MTSLFECSAKRQASSWPRSFRAWWTQRLFPWFRDEWSTFEAGVKIQFEAIGILFAGSSVLTGAVVVWGSCGWTWWRRQGRMTSIAVVGGSPAGFFGLKLSISSWTPSWFASCRLQKSWAKLSLPNGCAAGRLVTLRKTSFGFHGSF